MELLKKDLKGLKAFKKNTEATSINKLYINSYSIQFLRRNKKWHILKMETLLSTKESRRILRPNVLLGFILGKLIYKANYKKDYLQVVEIKKQNGIFLRLSSAKKVNEEIKENKFEFNLICNNKEIFQKFDIENMFLMETGREYRKNS